jgi:hypothetical protein
MKGADAALGGRGYRNRHCQGAKGQGCLTGARGSKSVPVCQKSQGSHGSGNTPAAALHGLMQDTQEPQTEPAGRQQVSGCPSDWLA